MTASICLDPARPHPPSSSPNSIDRHRHRRHRDTADTAQTDQALNGDTWVTKDDNTGVGDGAFYSSITIQDTGRVWVVGSRVTTTTTPFAETWLVRDALYGNDWETSSAWNLVAGYASSASSVAHDGAGRIFVAGYAYDANFKEHWIVRRSIDTGQTWTTVDDYHVTGQDAEATGIAVDGITGYIIVTGGLSTDPTLGFTLKTRLSTDHGVSFHEVDSVAGTCARAHRRAGGACSVDNTFYAVGTIATSHTSQSTIAPARAATVSPGPRPTKSRSARSTAASPVPAAACPAARSTRRAATATTATIGRRTGSSSAASTTASRSRTVDGYLRDRPEQRCVRAAQRSERLDRRRRCARQREQREPVARAPLDGRRQHVLQLRPPRRGDRRALGRDVVQEQRRPRDGVRLRDRREQRAARDRARAVVVGACGRDRRETIRGMSADFFSIAVALDTRRGPTLAASFAAAETEYNGNVYVDATEDAMELAGDDDALAMSSNYPALVAIDRFAARPAGISFLENHAYRQVDSTGRAGAVPGRSYDTLIRTYGSRASLIERVAQHLDRDDNVGEALDGLERALARATRAKQGVLVVCVPC